MCKKVRKKGFYVQENEKKSSFFSYIIWIVFDPNRIRVIIKNRNKSLTLNKMTQKTNKLETIVIAYTNLKH